MIHRTVIFGLVLAAPALAQLPSNLVGGARGPSSGTVQRQNATCAATPVCSGPVLGQPPQPFAGGTAYDPIRGVVWTTDGVMLTGIPSQSPPCVPYCAPMTVPGLTPGVWATGLAFQETGSATGSLWCVDSAHNLQRFSWSGNCPAVGTSCSIAGAAPSAFHRFGGLAISEVHARVFYVASDFLSSGPPNTWLFAAPLSNPCTPTCSTPVTVVNCPGLLAAPMTGLGFDDGNNTLYLTDGRFVYWTTFTPPCTFGPINCCGVPLTDPYCGLCVEPLHAFNVNFSCLTAPCPACTGMSLDAVGDSSLGNSSFGFRLTGGPAGAIALGFWNVGCMPAPGIPVLCGFFGVPVFPPPASFPPAVLAGAGCGGQAFHALPIPLNPALCGLTISAQDVIVCGTGTGMTNTVCTTISDT